nr:hypothetical protein [Nannocystis sp.]
MLACAEHNGHPRSRQPSIAALITRKNISPPFDAGGWGGLWFGALAFLAPRRRN